ncbi:Homeobox domain containing protein [Trichomonas vaginalis G3]|uniref:Homeobox domain containing protein n=1 Tax=Trichomonas vaginalis (strain ATCC PRA-98 / G3) TaxID=412133 RepID=A2F2B5_TRIV3|nr:DNA-binding transcription factor protein [Trichomonas vaginalis G3]EAY00934.1 Homeobox domain containing protein [Trichomonas vaginalis G3]KAI5552763.1 DNA-binding transcription factor protein [Trichomonas vaginalis G3]|eukprot:XP_001313863.1 Homeobox domain containing protein [Trichomonas vaginalis G3]
MCDLSEIDNVEEDRMEYITPYDQLWLNVLNDAPLQLPSFVHEDNILDFEDEDKSNEQSNTPESSASVSPLLATKFQESCIKITPFKLKVDTIQGPRFLCTRKQNIDNEQSDSDQKKDQDDSPLPRKKRFSKSAKQILNDWFENNIKNPYPSKEELAQLTKETGLSLKQLHTYFINKRVRCKQSYKNSWKKECPKKDLIISLKTLELINIGNKA